MQTNLILTFNEHSMVFKMTTNGDLCDSVAAQIMAANNINVS